MASVGGGSGGNKKGKGKGKGKKEGAATSTPALRDCASCGAPEGSIPGSPTHSACGRCKMTYYCSTKCQKQHCVKREDRRLVAGGKSSGGKDGTPASGGSAAAEEAECAI